MNFQQSVSRVRRPPALDFSLVLRRVKKRVVAKPDGGYLIYYDRADGAGGAK